MTWAMNHTESSRYASLAEISLRENDCEKAKELYRLAAEKEIKALAGLDSNKPRTLGITVVSAVSLFYKAHEFEKAENMAHQYLGMNALPSFAAQQLKELLQTIWNEKVFESYNIEFAKGDILVSVSGGEVVTGGAPLDLVLHKVEAVSAYFYRVIEMMLDRAFRKGRPDTYIQEQCRPWLFQAPPGSYQFAVRIQQPQQPSLFEDGLPKIEQITHKFMEIVEATSNVSGADLEKIVPNKEYRSVFLKMTRNLAPTGKTFSKLEFKQTNNAGLEPVVLIPESREIINKVLKEKVVIENNTIQEEQEVVLQGTLRALHLDKDWIEVTVVENDKDKHITIQKTGEIIDDIVGPMVNRRVIVDTVKNAKGTYYFRDIQLEE